MEIKGIVMSVFEDWGGGVLFFYPLICVCVINWLLYKLMHMCTLKHMKMRHKLHAGTCMRLQITVIIPMSLHTYTTRYAHTHT